jgi:hypothetical protein
MQLHTEHQVMLTTNHCAALLSAAKTILDRYKETDRDNEARDALQEAVDRIAEGMGLSPQKAASLMHFMATGEMQ